MEKIIVLIYNLMEKIIFYLKFLFLFVCPGDKGFCEKVKLKIILFFLKFTFIYYYRVKYFYQ